MVKDRGATNLELTNNSFIIEKAAFMRIGLLNQIKSDLSLLDNTDFTFDLFQIGGSNIFNKSYNIEGNTFKTPYINSSSEISSVASFIFKNNIIEVEYFGTSGKNTSVSRIGTFFLARNRYNLPHSSKARDFISENNNININKTLFKNIDWFNYPEGTQTGDLKLTDNEYNFENVRISDSFDIDNTIITYHFPDAKSQKYFSSSLGENSSFSFKNYPGVGHNRPNAESLEIRVKVKNDTNQQNHGVFIINPNSTQNIKVDLHKGKSIPVLSYNYLESLYPLKTNKGLFCTIELNYKTKNSKSVSTKTWVVFLDNNFRTFIILNEDNNLIDVSPYDKNLRSFKNKINFPYLNYSAGEGDTPFSISIDSTENIISYELRLKTDSVDYGIKETTKNQFLQRVTNK